MENEVKEPAPKYNFISPEEYLRKERASDEKHEYYDGYVQAMGQGASKEHIRIETNIIGELYAYLKNKEFDVMTGNMKVITTTHDTYMYPDALIIGGEPEWQDDHSDTLTNPSVIFEILSPSTQ